MMSDITLARGKAQAPTLLSRADCEDFLFLEAQLLDEWRLDEWFALFAEGATYDVPTAGSPDDVSSAAKLFYIADDYFRLRHRVTRLKKQSAHSEWPRSQVSRIVSNVRILSSDQDGVDLRSTFVTHRCKGEVIDMYCGHHLHRLGLVDGQLRILAKRSMLDMAHLRPQGRVSIIL
jgi:p-cumate 2,3-dioxygenase beta subunit